MIWFACKQCGKVHGRPENSVGTMVFCTCGEGTRVPWESTAAEPAQPAAAEPVPLADVASPKREPWPFDPAAVPGTRTPVARDRDPEPWTRGRAHSRSEPRRYDPSFCLNHATVRVQKACADCREGFCEECLVTFQGE